MLNVQKKQWNSGESVVGAAAAVSCRADAADLNRPSDCLSVCLLYLLWRSYLFDLWRSRTTRRRLSAKSRTSSDSCSRWRPGHTHKTSADTNHRHLRDEKRPFIHIQYNHLIYITWIERHISMQHLASQGLYLSSLVEKLPKLSKTIDRMWRNYSLMLCQRLKIAC